MKAFDLQDTLVHIDYNAVNLYVAIAQPDRLYTPDGPFIVISAQPRNGAIRGAIRNMIEKKFPNCTGVYFVGGTEAEIVAAKARQIRNHSVTEFTDNNEAILKKLSILLPDIKLYKITNGNRVAYNG